MRIDLSGKTAIVTGGTKGIGKSIVVHLIESGCHVVYTGTKDTHEPFDDSARYEQLDLSDDDSITSFTESVINRTTEVDILINNAGINIIEPIEELQDEHWERVIKVNLTGAMRLTRKVAQQMIIRERGGKVLNISSIWGVNAKAGRSAYAASKTGMIGLTRAAALDLAPHNILVNALCPGFTDTELTVASLSEEERVKLAADVPLGRFAEVSEIAKTAVFLCSDFNTFMTGQTVVIDGGFTIR